MHYTSNFQFLIQIFGVSGFDCKNLRIPEDRINIYAVDAILSVAKVTLPKALVLLAVLLIMLSGCSLKAKGPDQNVPAPIIPVIPEVPAGVLPGGGNAPETTNPLGLASPINCNDDLIVKNLGKYIGENYVVNKAPPPIGGTIQAAPCLIKRDNVAQVSYTISEQLDNTRATLIIEDEKNQYRRQLFNYSIEEAAIGSENYLFVQPVKEGALYRLLFIDDTDTKVVVFIKSGVPVDKELILNIGRALAEVI